MSVPGCPLGFFCVSGDLEVRLQSLFAIGSEIPAQLIAFLNKLFHLGIHPRDLFLRAALMETASVSALFRRLQKAS